MKSFVKTRLFDDISKVMALKNSLIKVIIGPRQVGKTTTVKNYLDQNSNEEFLYFSADNIFSNSKIWLIEKYGEALRLNKLLVIDEIQKIENWSEVIKSLWDQDKRECILLGSSSLDIQKGLSESLTGRFQLIRASHWNLFETKKLINIDLNTYLKFGGYPGSYNFFSEQSQLIEYVRDSIVKTVIEKDILQDHTVKSPALFKQAFEIIQSYPAQEISYTKLLGQLQDRGNVEIVKYYLSLYEGAFLIKSIFKYSEKKILTKSSSPKLIPLAPILYYLNIQDEYRSDEFGRIFEAQVGAILNTLPGNLYYWRERDLEVDYIYKKGRNVYAIEVKSGRRKSEKGLLAFKSRHPDTKIIFITPENYISFEKNPADYLEIIQ